MDTISQIIADCEREEKDQIDCIVTEIRRIKSLHPRIREIVGEDYTLDPKYTPYTTKEAFLEWVDLARYKEAYLLPVVYPISSPARYTLSKHLFVPSQISYHGPGCFHLNAYALSPIVTPDCTCKNMLDKLSSGYLAYLIGYLTIT